jgi:cyclic pyranopterin phosphate synthase
MADHAQLTHLDKEGRVRMVDVGYKADTERVAVAKGEVHMRPETLRLIVQDKLPKGDVLTTAQLAGIMAAKQTPDLIPLCHPLLLTQVDVAFEVDAHSSAIEITATVRTRGKTGVEMEALTAVSVAALTLYDMAKAVEKGMRIQNVRLVRKSGGKSGELVLEESTE